MMGAFRALTARPSKILLSGCDVWDVDVLRAVGAALKGPGLRFLELQEGHLSDKLWSTLPWLMAQLPDLTFLEMHNVSLVA
jgi:hypothetical protein